MVSLLAMLLADGRFPAGGYAHSLGLEQAVADGLAGADVASFIAARLRLVAEPEARLAVAARRGTLRDGVEGALDVDAEFGARCPSPVLRESA
ncbi:MAG: urease accessory protein, partial [Solirubrobacteraceae bacterium]|nr:urease accessory protein [Solirubrobacteraceae bacterium]